MSAPSPSEEQHAHLFARLAPQFGGRLCSLVLTRNRRRILSVRPDPAQPRGLALRLDACFVQADTETLAEIAAWSLAKRAHRKPLHRARAHFEHYQSVTEPPAARRPRRIRTQGRYLDLADLFTTLNERYFENQVDAMVTWGSPLRRRPRKRRRTKRQVIRLGSYDTQHHLIRIHRVLDRPEVPQVVVESVLHHEMIHAVLPPEQTAHQRRFHTPEFRQLERRYQHQGEADQWIRQHLDWLLEKRYLPG